MKIPASLRILLGMQYTNVFTLIGFMAASSMITGIRDAYGYFQYVLIGFALLFTFLEVDVITCYREMKNLDVSIFSADSL